MAWIFATTVLLLAVFVPGFRVLAVRVLGGLLLIGLGVWGYFSWAESRVRNLILPSEVLLEDMRLASPGAGWHLSDRLRNKSPKHTLSAISVDVLVKDCAASELPQRFDDPEEVLRQIDRQLREGSTQAHSNAVKRFDDPAKALEQLEHQLLGAPAGHQANSGKCDIVGQKEVKITLDVPPGQVRSIEEQIYFPAGTNAQKTMNWEYILMEIRGK